MNSRTSSRQPDDGSGSDIWNRAPVRPREPVLIRFRRTAWLVPTSFMVAVVLVGLLTGPSVRVGNWFLLVPLLAAGLCSVPETVVFGLVVLLINRLINGLVPDVHLRIEDFLLEVVAVILAVAVAVVRDRARVYVRHLQSTADTTRQVLLRPIPPSWGGLESDARYIAADVEARVGGDFYEVLATPHGARVALGDVQGKGLPAVSTAGALVGAFREAGYHESDLGVVAQRMEEGLSRHNLLRAQSGEATDRFATAAVVSFPRADPGYVEVVNFGHEGPLVIGPHGVRRLPQEQGPPVGMAELAGGLPPVCRVPLDRQDTVLLVTDGVTEARNRAGEFFPLQVWLEQLSVGRPDGIAPSLLLSKLVDAVLRHTNGRLTDDIALLAVRQLPAADRGEPVPHRVPAPEA